MGDNYEKEVKSIISGVVTSNPLSCTIKQLQKDYKNMVGEDIPFRKLGYNSIDHCLRSMSDIVKVTGQGPFAQLKPISGKSAHVNELVVKQKLNISSNCSNRAAVMLRKRSLQTPMNSKINNVQSNMQNGMAARDNCMMSHLNGLRSLPKMKSLLLQSNINRTCNGYSDNRIDNSTREYKVNGVSDCNDTELNEKQISPDKSITDKDKKKKYIFIPEKIPEPTRTIEFSPLEENAKATLEKYGEKVEEGVQTNLKRLISMHPLGIWCRDLPVQYSRMFKANLDYLDYEYQSLIALCMDLPHIFHYVRPADGDFKLYDRDSPLPEEAEKTFTLASYRVETSEDDNDEDWEELKKYLPDDIVINKKIPRRFLDENVHVGNPLKIAICEISDFNQFWVQLEENIPALDTLMDDLQIFYNKHNGKYAVPHYLVQEGLTCVCKFSTEYHRAVVFMVYDTTSDVKVFLPDYGTICSIPRDDLCLLAEPFAQLPFQAIECNLDCVDVDLKDNILRYRFTKVFYDLVNQREILATIKKIDRKNEVIDLYLVDKETNQSINDIMSKKLKSCMQ